MKTETLFECLECETEFWVESSCWHMPLGRCPDCLSWDTTAPVYASKALKARLGRREV